MLCGTPPVAHLKIPSPTDSQRSDMCLPGTRSWVRVPQEPVETSHRLSALQTIHSQVTREITCAIVYGEAELMFHIWMVGSSEVPTGLGARSQEEGTITSNWDIGNRYA